MEEIKKDGKVIATMGNANEAFWQNSVARIKVTVDQAKDSLKFWEPLLLAAERELLKAKRNHK